MVCIQSIKYLISLPLIILIPAFVSPCQFSRWNSHQYFDWLEWLLDLWKQRTFGTRCRECWGLWVTVMCNNKKQIGTLHWARMPLLLGVTNWQLTDRSHYTKCLSKLTTNNTTASSLWVISICCGAVLLQSSIPWSDSGSYQWHAFVFPSAGGKDELMFCKLFGVLCNILYQTLALVFDHVSKHREGKLQKGGAAEFFNKSSRCLETLSNTCVSVWYNSQTNTYFRRKQRRKFG